MDEDGTPIWEVEYTDEFESWWGTLSDTQLEDVDAVVQLLQEQGPSLRFPYSCDVKESRHGHMRELRVQSGGRPIRIFYAFDPRRSAILLIGGDKTGNDRFYVSYVPRADRLYDEYMDELRQEGLIQ